MKKTITKISLATLLGISVFAPVASAERASGSDSQAQEIRAERNKIQEKIESADADLVNVLYEIETLNNKIGKLDSSIKKTDKEIKENEKAISELEKEVFEIEDRIVRRTDILKERLVAIQATGGEGQVVFLETLTGEISFAEAVSRANAIKSISDADIQLVVDLEEDQVKLEEKQTELSDKKEKLEAAKEKEQTEKKELEADKKDLTKKEKELKTIKADLQLEDRELASLQASIRSDIQAVAAPAPTSQRSVVATSSGSQAGPSRATNNKPNKPAKTNGPAQSTGFSSAISAGRSVMGTPYKTAGKGPGGFDCSGFVSWAYGQAGVSIPSYTGALVNIGTKVPSLSQAKPGDLVFFNTAGRNGHVGIYLGGGQFIGSQSSTGVAIANMNSGYWRTHFSGTIRRIN